MRIQASLLSDVTEGKPPGGGYPIPCVFTRWCVGSVQLVRRVKQTFTFLCTTCYVNEDEREAYHLQHFSVLKI